MRLLAAVLFVVAVSTAAYAGGPPPPGVPEIDPSFAAGALTLLASGLMVLTSRLRK